MLLANENVNGISITRFQHPTPIKTFANSSKSACFVRLRDTYFVSIDNMLYASKDLKDWQNVLQVKARNFIWHICHNGQILIAQEYGESPTYLYKSIDGIEWQQFLSNKDVDKTSRHWHSVAYDRERECVYVTLGDVNITTVVKLDNNLTWEPLYSGQWQFVPIVPTKDKVVFGLDTDLVAGGTAIYHPNEDIWDYTFTRWEDSKFQIGQFCDLKLLDTGIWIAALGAPSAIIVSQDLQNWASAGSIIDSSLDFNHYMQIEEGNDYVAISTGKSLMIYEKQEIMNISSNQPIMRPYNPSKQKAMGIVRMMKRRLFGSKY